MKALPIRGQKITENDGRLNLTGTILLEQMVNNLVVVSPNGTQYRITVDDAGNLGTEAI